jgi:hypothetical protein
MWPFKQKPEPDITQETIDELKAFREVGEKFNYMGIEMIVESHCQYTIDGAFPRIYAAYKNSMGELKHAQFVRAELPALQAENP